MFSGDMIARTVIHVMKSVFGTSTTGAKGTGGEVCMLQTGIEATAIVFTDTCLVEHDFSRNKIAKEMVFNLIILPNNKIQRFDRLGHLQVNEKILKLYCNK